MKCHYLPTMDCFSCKRNNPSVWYLNQCSLIIFNTILLLQSFFGRMKNHVVMERPNVLPFFWRTKKSVALARPDMLAFVLPNKESCVMASPEAIPFFYAIFRPTKNSVVMGRPEALPILGWTKNLVALARPKALLFFDWQRIQRWHYFVRNKEFSG